jgi:hypothetical protein
MSWPLGPRRRDSLGQYSPRQHGTGPGIPSDAEVQVAQYKHRGYSISISIKRFDDKVKVETEIFLPPDVDDRDGDRSLAVTRRNLCRSSLSRTSTKRRSSRLSARSTCSLLSDPRCPRCADEARRKMPSTSRGVPGCRPSTRRSVTADSQEADYRRHQHRPRPIVARGRCSPHSCDGCVASPAATSGPSSLPLRRITGDGRKQIRYNFFVNELRDGRPYRGKAYLGGYGEKWIDPICGPSQRRLPASVDRAMTG